MLGEDLNKGGRREGLEICGTVRGSNAKKEETPGQK
jgi:hypothetical protein